MAKMEKDALQKAFDYVLYMISSSYCEKQPQSRNPFYEDSLYLHYRETPYPVQIEMEEACIRYMENTLPDILRNSSKTLSHSDNGSKPGAFNQGIVRLIPNRTFGVTEIRYETAEYILRLMGRYDAGTHKTKFASDLIFKLDSIR